MRKKDKISKYITYRVKISITVIIMMNEDDNYYITLTAVRSTVP